ncbi:MAG: hypothetical protein K5640_05895 [Treponema sp.]|nr:hypothetical protein [Treponema sp.]
MNRKSLVEKILDKWPYKVACIVIAIFLYIFHEASLVTKKTFIVPLTISENGLVMHVSDSPSTVSVIVRASEENIKSIQTADIQAFANIDFIPYSGQVKIPVTLKISDEVMSLSPLEVRLAEEYVTLHVEKKISKYIPLSATVVGAPLHGYEVENVFMTPSVVLVTGPESMINAVEEIPTTKITVSNAQTNFSTETTLNQIDNILSIEDEGPYTATVIIVPELMEKEFSEVTPEVLNLVPNLVIDGELETVTVNLAGTVPALENYNLPSKAVSINLSEFTEPGTYTVPVRYNISSNFELISVSEENLTVVLINKPEETEAENAEGEL